VDFGGWSSQQVITIIICITVAIVNGMVLSKKRRGIKKRRETYWKIKMFLKI